MLSLENLTVRYGGLSALTNVSINVQAGEFVTIIGPNGAGKTTLLKAISGVVRPMEGRVVFEGRDLASVPAPRRPKLGIAHVPEYRQVFGGLSVRENLELGTTSLEGRGDRRANVRLALELFPILAEKSDQLAGMLSGGQQQMLAIARGLVSSPKLLLLDEPSMGLAPAIVDMIFERIVSIRKETDVTIILVEQRAVEALELCDRAYVLSTGNIVAEGSGQELLGDSKVNRAYLGM
jgi:branched-chain amino acid transport system ATP-binding protein